MASYGAVHHQSQEGNSPYGSGDPYYAQSVGYITPSSPAKKGTSAWIKFGIPVAILVVAGAVIGAVLGTRAHKSSSSTDAASSSASASAAASAAAAIGLFPTATNSEFMLPIYPSTTNTAAFTTPTFASSSSKAWPQDSFQPSDPSPTSVRTDRPRIIAPAYKWAVLSNRIANDAYLTHWNESIFGNATTWAAEDIVPYVMDGGNGILDVARAIKIRIKAFAYAYRMTNNTAWVDRTWSELQNAAGNGTSSFGPDDDKWNSEHFLDTAELTASFGIAYDWLYDMWTDDQKSMIRFTMNKYGLAYGINAYTTNTNYIGWWNNNITGNWNCVCNGGLTIGALAILGDDTTGNAAQMLGYTVDNALANCAFGVTDDGTWTETPDYWYFGTTSHAEMSSALLTATGSDYGLTTTNSNFYKTGLFHMYNTGFGSLFNYGDNGPNKYSATANSLIFYASQYNQPQYALFQRDMPDSVDPWNMFWYDSSISGAFWDGMALDYFFDNELDQWGVMRSSWTQYDGIYAAIKAGKLQGHQTHNDLDCGDFVLDALGTRWAGELGDGDYLSLDYFSNDTQGSTRWTYYRKATEGQNTILVNEANQLVTAAPTVSHGSSGTAQGSSTVMNVSSDSTAYWIGNITSAYSDVTSFSRGMRMINSRMQVLLQDEITASESIMWRMHTNATVAVDSSGTSATLTLDGQTMIVQLINAPSGAKFTTMDAVRLTGGASPSLVAGQTDQENPGVTVLCIELDAGTYNLQVLFNPQWPGMSSSDFVTPSSVDLSSWSLTSHP